MERFENRNFWYKQFSLMLLLFLIAGYFLSHVPFLEADADLRMETGSIGAWTDEGLNTSQVRNVVNHGHFDLLECDNLLKTPLFSLFHFIQMGLFGSGLLQARLATLVLTGFILFQFARWKDHRLLLILLIPTTLLLFTYHQYGHMSLAETVSVSCFAAAGFYYNRFSNTREFRFVAFCSGFIFLGILFKIQFLFLSPILPIVLFFDQLVFKKEKINTQLIKIIISYVFLLGLILVVWYIPFKEEWALIAKQQSGSLSFSTIDRESLNLNVERYFLTHDFILFTIIFVLAFFYSIYSLLKDRVGRKYFGLLIFALIWVLLETHKLPMIYLPSRYVVSTYFSMGLLISVVVAIIWENHTWRSLKWISLLAVIVLMIHHLGQIQSAFNSRSFKIKEANDYLNAHTKPEDVVIGPWAPAFTWTSGNVSMPIWSDFLRTNNIIGDLKPRVIVSESDERDSGLAYSSRGIDLNSISDSVRSFQIANREIKIYWIKKSIK